MELVSLRVRLQVGLEAEAVVLRRAVGTDAVLSTVRDAVTPLKNHGSD